MQRKIVVVADAQRKTVKDKSKEDKEEEKIMNIKITDKHERR